MSGVKIESIENGTNFVTEKDGFENEYQVIYDSENDVLRITSNQETIAVEIVEKNIIEIL